MRAAFQKDDAFLADVKRSLTRGERALWWLGQSGFLVVNGGRAIVLDPYLSDSLTRKYDGTDKPHVRMTELVVKPAALAEVGVIDLITSSHNHTDHLDAETLAPLLSAQPRASLVIPAANRDFVLSRLGGSVRPKQLVELDSNISATVGDVEMIGIAACHPTVECDDSGRCRFLGYVIRWGGMRIYHSGDTLLHPGLVPALKPLNVDVALLPINGDRPERRVAGNLNGAEAAQLAHEIGAKLVIPCHFDLFEFNTESPDLFESECRRLSQPFRILKNGERLALPAN